jgi:hypothetical protein
MNITKEFHEYINIVKNTFSSKFQLKCERYGALDKCSRVLRQIVDVERNIDTITASKKF